MDQVNSKLNMPYHQVHDLENKFPRIYILNKKLLKIKENLRDSEVRPRVRKDI